MDWGKGLAWQCSAALAQGRAARRSAQGGLHGQGCEGHRALGNFGCACSQPIE